MTHLTYEPKIHELCIPLSIQHNQENSSILKESKEKLYYRHPIFFQKA